MIPTEPPIQVPTPSPTTPQSFPPLHLQTGHAAGLGVAGAVTLLLGIFVVFYSFYSRGSIPTIRQPSFIKQFSKVTMTSYGGSFASGKGETMKKRASASPNIAEPISEEPSSFHVPELNVRGSSYSLANKAS